MKFMTVSLPEEILREEGAGNFSKAKNMIKQRLKDDLPAMMKERLRYELERIDRILKCYGISEEEARKKLFDSITEFSESEYRRLNEIGALDCILIEGKRVYETRFFENLIFLNPEYRKRIKEDEDGKKAKEYLHKRLNELISGDRPKKYRVIAEIRLKPKIEDGKEVRCWLPFPKEEFPITSVKMLSCSHEEYRVSPNETPQRTIYMEDTSGEDLEFSVRFEYTIQEQITRVDPEKVLSSEKYEFLKENPPHIIFTPYIRELTSEIVGKEKNPYLKAKRIYDWITMNVRYSYMHPYSLYENIPQFCASNLRGDCGVQALLFITMCRIAGVPARWQSGWYANPIRPGPHDWAVFYVHPYGWLPADLSFGGARRDIQEYREFYFGNLDAFRMIANSQYMGEILPRKKYWRSDPYDNQIGELETESENIYIDLFKHEINIISFEEIE